MRLSKSLITQEFRQKSPACVPWESSKGDCRFEDNHKAHKEHKETTNGYPLRVYFWDDNRISQVTFVSFEFFVVSYT